MRAIYSLFLACLLITSCDNFQYYFSSDGDDISVHDMNSIGKMGSTNTDLGINNPYTFSLDNSTWTDMDYYGKTIYYVYKTDPGDFHYPLDCKSNQNMSTEYIPNEKQYTSLFFLKLTNPNFSSFPNTDLGKWKFRINGFYKARNFISLQITEFAYWLDSMEIYARTKNSLIFLGVIQGNDWLQADSSAMEPIIFERWIPTGVRFESIEVRFIRRCVKSARFDFNKLNPIPPSIVSDQPSEFKIESVEFLPIP